MGKGTEARKDRCAIPLEDAALLPQAPAPDNPCVLSKRFLRPLVRSVKALPKARHPLRILPLFEEIFHREVPVLLFFLKFSIKYPPFLSPETADKSVLLASETVTSYHTCHLLYRNKREIFSHRSTLYYKSCVGMPFITPLSTHCWSDFKMPNFACCHVSPP